MSTTRVRESSTVGARADRATAAATVATTAAATVATPGATTDGTRPPWPLLTRWPPSPRQLRIARAVGAVLWVAALAWFSVQHGVPFDRLGQVPWLLSLVVILTLGRSWQHISRVLRDWSPFIGALVVYDYSRGLASHLGLPVLVAPQVALDQLFAPGGQVPTVWLQAHLYRPGHVAWWEVAVSLVYVSHFVVPWLAAAVLYVRAREAWAAWARRILGLSALGLVAFVLVPTAPPWWAAQDGELPAISRIATRGWDLLGLRTAGALVERGQATANDVAALPSLHTAFAVMFALFFWRRSPRWLRPVLLAYPLAMGFVLVYSGEHFVVDVIAGALCALLVHRVATAWEARRSGELRLLVLRPVTLDVLPGTDGAFRLPRGHSGADEALREPRLRAPI